MRFLALSDVVARANVLVDTNIDVALVHDDTVLAWVTASVASFTSDDRVLVVFVVLGRSDVGEDRLAAGILVLEFLGVAAVAVAGEAKCLLDLGLCEVGAVALDAIGDFGASNKAAGLSRHGVCQTGGSHEAEEKDRLERVHHCEGVGYGK